MILCHPVRHLGRFMDAIRVLVGSDHSQLVLQSSILRSENKGENSSA